MNLEGFCTVSVENEKTGEVMPCVVFKEAYESHTIAYPISVIVNKIMNNTLEGFLADNLSIEIRPMRSKYELSSGAGRGQTEYVITLYFKNSNLLVGPFEIKEPDDEYKVSTFVHSISTRQEKRGEIISIFDIMVLAVFNSSSEAFAFERNLDDINATSEEIRHLIKHGDEEKYEYTIDYIKELKFQDGTVPFNEEKNSLEEVVGRKPRISSNEYFMNMVEVTSSRASCDRLSVGCILVKDKTIIATGYNGSITKHPHCDEIGHLMYSGGCKRTIHAEMNAIISCARDGRSTVGSVAYVTHYPCPDCMKHLNQAGVTKIYYKHHYDHRYENNFHEGMELVQLS